MPMRCIERAGRAKVAAPGMINDEVSGEAEE